MSILKPFEKINTRYLILAMSMSVVLVLTGGVEIWKLSIANPKTSLKIDSTEVTEYKPLPSVPAGPQAVVASKAGKRYHLPSCPGAKQIAVKNLINFDSIEAAEQAGYTPAANCKGLSVGN